MTSQDLTFPRTGLKKRFKLVWQSNRPWTSLAESPSHSSFFLSLDSLRSIYAPETCCFSFIFLFSIFHLSPPPPPRFLLFFFFVTDRHVKNRFTDRYAFGSQKERERERPRLRNECYGAASAHPLRNRKLHTSHNETMRLLRARKERRGAACPREISFPSPIHCVKLHNCFQKNCSKNL